MSEAVEQTCCCVRLAWLGVCELEGPLKRSPKELRSSKQYPQRSEIPSSPRLTSPKERRSSEQYPQRSEIPSSVNLRNVTNPNLLNMSHDRPLPARSALFCMPGEALDVFACLAIYVIASLLGGSFWLGFRFLKMCLKRFRGVGDYPQLVSRKYRLHHRRQGVRVRIKTRFCYVRVDVERTLVFSRHVVKPTWSSGFKASLKFACKAMCLGLCLDRNLWSLLVCMAWCCAWGVCGCCLLRRKGDDGKGSRSNSEHSHLRVVRGLPLPGKGTQAEPLELDSDMPRSSEREERGGKESPLPKPQGVEPPKPPEPPGGAEVSDRIPLRSVALQVHRSRGHFPYDVNCEACTSSKGKVPARRLRRRLQREDQTIGMDFYYFGRLRVLLLAHCSSNYTTAIPAMNLDDPDLFYNIGRVIREMGLVNKMVTVRCDQESALMSLAEKLTTRTGDVAVSGVIVDVVPGYRPQSKGAIERQVETMKQGFWAVWLDLEREVARNSAPEDWNKKLPLGGMLWQACVLYSARCYNLWSFSHQDVTTPIDRLHEEIVHRTRTLPFGCLVYAKVGGSKAHQQKYRGKKTVKAVYLGPKEPRGGGIFAAPLGQTEIDVFPVCRALEGAKGEPVYDVGAIHALSTSQPLVLDPADPERPIMFEPPPDPVKSEDPDPGFENEDEEMVPDDPDPLNDVPSYVEPTDDEGEGGLGSPEMQPDDLEDMEIDWLTNHLLESLFKGPDILATSKEVADSFTLKFGGSKIKCQVPRNAVSETSGEQLDPELLYASMKLELEELESFGVGKVISEAEARKSARESGRRVLTSRWVNTIKRKGLYRSRLVVRDYASMGGTTLSEGIYSPTTSLEGLRLLLALLCKKGSVLSCDVSVAFMHAAVSRPEYVELPNNVSIADSSVPQKAGNKKVYLRLHKAMNGLRSAPLSWYKELSSYLEKSGFSPSLDPTIYRRKTSKGLTLVLFYVDDLLIYSEDPSEGKRVFEGLQKRYKLKLTGEIPEHGAGEVSFLGRRIFRRSGDKRVYFGLDSKYLDTCCSEYNITKPSPKLPSLEKRYSDLVRKGQTEKISPAAHEKYRRTLGRLAWAALSRPDLQFCCGFLGRHQAAPDEAAETCMRDVLKWIKGLPHRVQVFPSTREILEDDADPQAVSCFTDASWSLNSVSGGVITWENCCLKTFSRKQSTTALSSAESELAALTEIAREGLYIALLIETILEGIPQDRETGYYLLKGYSDSESAVCISKMGTLLRKVRHIELRAAFLQELVDRGRFTIEHIPGAINPADALTKSPTNDSLASLCEACGLTTEPVGWEEKASGTSVSVTFKEPNTCDEVLAIPSSWKDEAYRVASGEATMVVLELCCEEESAIAQACKRERDIAYFGITKKLDLLSREASLLLKGILEKMASNERIYVYAHLSTPCSAGSGLRHLRFSKDVKNRARWRASLEVHKKSWRRIRAVFQDYAGHERLLLSHEWPKGSGLWGETVYKSTAKRLGLEHECLVDRCCFEEAGNRILKHWWFVSSDSSFIWTLSSCVCPGNHEHASATSIAATGVYPEGLGRFLVKEARRSLERRKKD